MPDDMDYDHTCRHCERAIRPASMGEGWVGRDQMTGTYGEGRHLHEPSDTHVPYNRENDRRALEYADMSAPETHNHHYDEAGGNGLHYNDTVVHEHPTGHSIHVVPPGRPGGRHEVRIDSPDGESEYPERFGKDIALDRPDDMPKSLHPHIHKAFDHAEEMDKAPRNQAPHEDEVPLPGEGLDDYLKRMRERDNRVHENLPANHPSREGHDSDLHEYGNESQLHGHMMDPEPHGHGYHDDGTLDNMRRAGAPLRDLHRMIHSQESPDHQHSFSLERRDRPGQPLSNDEGIFHASDHSEYFNNSWGHGSTGTGHRHRTPAQYENPNTPQRRTELQTHLSQHHGYEIPGSMSVNEAAQMHVTHHGGDLQEVGGGQHNGGLNADHEQQHDWRHRHLAEDHGIHRSYHMSDDALNEVHERAHESGVMNEDHSHEPHPDSRNHHPSDCLACAAGEGMSHNYEPPSEGHHAMKTIAMNAQDDTGEHFVRANLTPEDAREAGLALLRQARVQIEAGLTKVAHDSGDGETIYHCPFCGSGQVVARSDRTIECDFCHTSFTVQVQPEFSAFPQTIDGAPVDVPGMPGQVQQNDPNAVSDPNAPMDPSQMGDGDPASFAGPPGPNNQPPWLKGAYRTESGAVLDEDSFIKHLALKVSDRDPGVLVQVRAENLAP
jgi:hypothetical protein